MAQRTTDPDAHGTAVSETATAPVLDSRVAEDARTAANRPSSAGIPDPETDFPDIADPYHLTERSIQDPPTSF